MLPTPLFLNILLCSRCLCVSLPRCIGVGSSCAVEVSCPRPCSVATTVTTATTSDRTIKLLALLWLLMHSFLHVSEREVDVVCEDFANWPRGLCRETCDIYPMRILSVNKYFGPL